MAKKDLAYEISGMEELRDLLRLAGQQAPKLMAGPLFRFAQSEIMRKSKDSYVPVVTAALKNSIQTYGPYLESDAVEVIVGAGNSAVKYAVSVHENPRSGKTGGVSPSGRKYPDNKWSRVGQWKYLEHPAVLAANHPEKLIQAVSVDVSNWFYKRNVKGK